MKSWATLLQEEEAKGVKQPMGKGWLTMEQIAEQMGCGRQKAYRIVRQATKESRCEVFNGTQYTADKSQRTKAVWYRLK